MITVKKDDFSKYISEMMIKSTSDDRLVKPYFAIQLFGPNFVSFDDKKTRSTKEFPEHLFHTYQHVDDRECPAYHDDTKIVLREPTTNSHENVIYPCNVGGCLKHCGENLLILVPLSRGNAKIWKFSEKRFLHTFIC